MEEPSYHKIIDNEMCPSPTTACKHSIRSNAPQTLSRDPGESSEQFERLRFRSLGSQDSGTSAERVRADRRMEQSRSQDRKMKEERMVRR